MPATITAVPTYPMPGDVGLVFTPSTSEYYLRLYATGAPEGSHLKVILDSGTTTSRTLIWQGYMDEEPTLVFDTGGRYSLTLDVFTKGATDYGGGYDGDPSSFLTETVSPSESTSLEFDVGQRIESVVGAAGFGAAILSLWVWGDTVRATNTLEHETVTPVIYNPSTDAATIALQSSSVITSVNDLVDSSSSSLLGDLALLCADFQTKVIAHMTNGGGAWHSVADAINAAALARLPSSPTAPQALTAWARELRQSLRNHMENGQDPFHSSASGLTEFPDLNNLPASDVAGGTREMRQMIAVLADAFRAYEDHRVATPSHLIADGTNSMSVALGGLLSLHRNFIEELRSTSGTGAPQLNPGASKLTQLAGFTETTGIS